MFCHSLFIGSLLAQAQHSKNYSLKLRFKQSKGGRKKNGATVGAIALCFLRRFDTVGWETRRTSSSYKPMQLIHTGSTPDYVHEEN